VSCLGVVGGFFVGLLVAFGVGVVGWGGVEGGWGGGGVGGGGDDYGVVFFRRGSPPEKKQAAPKPSCSRHAARADDSPSWTRPLQAVLLRDMVGVGGRAGGGAARGGFGEEGGCRFFSCREEKKERPWSVREFVLL